MKLDERTLMILALAGAAAAVYWFVIRPAGAVVGAVGEAGRSINDGIIPGVDSLGTWFYGFTHPNDPDPTAPVTTTRPAPISPYDYGFGAGTGPLRPSSSQVQGVDDPLSFFWGT